MWRRGRAPQGAPPDTLLSSHRSAGLQLRLAFDPPLHTQQPSCSTFTDQQQHSSAAGTSEYACQHVFEQRHVARRRATAPLMSTVAGHPAKNEMCLLRC